MGDEIIRRDEPAPRDEAPSVHVRTVVIRPTSALGKFALAAGLIAAGVLMVSIGVALVAGLAAVAAVTGVGVVAYRALARGRVPPPDPAQRLDPSHEVFLPGQKD